MTNRQTLDAVLRTDFLAFVQMVFRTLLPGEQFLANWHIDAVVYELEKVRAGETKRLIVNLPPRYLKSMIASIAWPAFILGHNPSARIMCLSYGQPLSGDLARDFRRIVESDWYKRIFPKTIFTKKTEVIMETSLGGERRSDSLDGAITGFGAQYIIIDDPMKSEDAMSQAAREKVINFYTGTLHSRLNNPEKSAFILVMQRLHEDDLSGFLLRQGGWSHLNLPTIAAKDEIIELGRERRHVRAAGEVLHPERQSRTSLEETRRLIGSMRFEAQYQQHPLPARGNILQRDWIRWYDRRPDLSVGRKVLSWDTALKGDPSCDFSVCTAWLELDNHHYLIDVFRKQLDFPDLKKAAIRLNNEFHPDCVLIEDRGSGTGLIQELKALGLTVVGAKPTDDKISRFSNVTDMFEAGQVSFPTEAPWLADLLHELLGFPSGRYDDQVDSISQYLRRARDRSRGMFNVDWGWGPGGVPTAEEILGLR